MAGHWPKEFDEAEFKDFRKFLESSGVRDAFVEVIVQLYKEPERPTNVLDYIQYALARYVNDVKINHLEYELEKANKKINYLEREINILKADKFVGTGAIKKDPLKYATPKTEKSQNSKVSQGFPICDNFKNMKLENSKEVQVSSASNPQKVTLNFDKSMQMMTEELAQVLAAVPKPLKLPTTVRGRFTVSTVNPNPLLAIDAKPKNASKNDDKHLIE